MRGNLSKVEERKVLCHLHPHAVFSKLLYVVYLSRYHRFPFLLLQCYERSRRWYWNFWLVLIFIDHSPSLVPLILPFSLCPLSSAVYFSLCQLAALAACHTGACRSARDRCSGSQAKRRKGVETGRRPQKKERRSKGVWGKERQRDREEKRQKKMRDEWDNRELALPVVSKGTQCWIRPQPIITARWALEGREQRGRLKNKIAGDVFRVRLQPNFILKASCTVST